MLMKPIAQIVRRRASVLNGLLGANLKPVALLAVIAAAAQAGPGAGVARATEDATRTVVAIDGLSLRAAPRDGARIIQRLPILTEVIRLGRSPRPAVIGGRNDSWVYVQANFCPDPRDNSLSCETVFKKGWLAESYLAYDRRFEPMTAWRDGAIEGQAGNTSWSYTFGADGTFALDWEAWSHFRKYDPCPAEEQRDGFCVKTRAETGRLHRYRNVVRAGMDGEFLYIDDRGALCGRMSSPGEPLCDR